MAVYCSTVIHFTSRKCHKISIQEEPRDTKIHNYSLGLPACLYLFIFVQWKIKESFIFQLWLRYWYFTNIRDLAKLAKLLYRTMAMASLMSDSPKMSTSRLGSTISAWNVAKSATSYVLVLHQPSNTKVNFSGSLSDNLLSTTFVRQTMYFMTVSIDKSDWNSSHWEDF